MRYSIEHRDPLQKTCKNLSSKYVLSFKTLKSLKTLKTSSKKVIQKTAKVSGDLVGSKIAEKITKAATKNKKMNDHTNLVNISTSNRNTYRKKQTTRKVTANY